MVTNFIEFWLTTKQVTSFTSTSLNIKVLALPAVSNILPTSRPCVCSSEKQPLQSKSLNYLIRIMGGLQKFILIVFCQNFNKASMKWTDVWSIESSLWLVSPYKKKTKNKHVQNCKSTYLLKIDMKFVVIENK